MALGLEVLSRYKHMLLAPGVEKLPIDRQGRLKQRLSPLSAQGAAGDFLQSRRGSQQLPTQKELSQLNCDFCPAIATTLPSPRVTGPQPFVSKSKAHL